MLSLGQACPGEIRKGRWFSPVLPLELFPRRPLFAEGRWEGDQKTMIPPATGGTDDPNSFSLNPDKHKKLGMGKYPPKTDAETRGRTGSGKKKMISDFAG
jgi:hypothetical protein